MKKALSLALTLALSASLAVPAAASGVTFADVPADHWAAAPIYAMTERGLFSGTTAPWTAWAPSPPRRP